MRDYGKVFTKFWESEDIRALSDDGRLLALYLMTCTHGTIAGVFRLPDGYACEDLQWPSERVSDALSELLSKGFANRCETTKWVWVRKHLEWNPPENPNQRKSAVKIAASVPNECGWKLDFMRVCGPSLGIEPPDNSNPSGTLNEGFLNQKQKQYQEQEHSEAKASGGKPPADPVKQEIWDAGRSLLLQSRMPPKQAGTFLGKLVTDYGAPIVLDAVRAAVKEQPADAGEYLKACCLRMVGQRKPAEPAWRTEQRERTQIAAPGVAVGDRPAAEFFIDVAARDVTVPALTGASK